MRSFATGVLGMRVVGQDTEDFVDWRWPTGRSWSSSAALPSPTAPGCSGRNPVVAGFLVDDIEAARDELARAPGVELLGDLRIMPDGYAWQHFRAPDGHVYELTADPAAG